MTVAAVGAPSERRWVRLADTNILVQVEALDLSPRNLKFNKRCNEFKLTRTGGHDQAAASVLLHGITNCLCNVNGCRLAQLFFVRHNPHCRACRICYQQLVCRRHYINNLGGMSPPPSGGRTAAISHSQAVTPLKP